MINHTSILLLNLDPASVLAASLCEILNSEPNLTILTQPSSLSSKTASYSQELTNLVGRSRPSAVFLILPQPILESHGDILRTLKKAHADVPLLVANEANQPDELFALLELGAADFVTPPLKAVDIFPRIWRLTEQKDRRERLVQKLKEKIGLQQLIGESETFRAATKKIPLIARCNASVLISGETGTGKELCARAIHYLSPRAHHPFVPINCGAVPVELVENELFGHERGAFTDASKAQSGVIQEADGGSLFLDEVDGMPLAAQVKLLRFLQDKEYRPLGSAKARTSDVRIIAAANADLEEEVRTGRLRRDLFYRLNVIPLQLPPLRERRQDIPSLARHFLAQYVVEYDKPVGDFSTDALQQLQRHDWPGNVRELEHLVARAVALTEREVIGIEDLALPGQVKSAPPASFRAAKDQFERAYVEDLLSACQGNITKAAKSAHKNRRAFWELIRKYQIDVNSFKANLNSPSANK